MQLLRSGTVGGCRSAALRVIRLFVLSSLCSFAFGFSGLFLRFYHLPDSETFLRRVGLQIAEYVRMAPYQLLGEHLNNVVEAEPAVFLGNVSLHDNLKQNIA